MHRLHILYALALEIENSTVKSTERQGVVIRSLSKIYLI